MAKPLGHDKACNKVCNKDTKTPLLYHSIVLKLYYMRTFIYCLLMLILFS